ncbi:MAG: hypothetical protein PHF21_04165 [Bacilli bacterium]|nr:hypothetical protein [Bacilli bacterium]
MNKHKALGPILAIIFVLILSSIGYFSGKYIAYKYNEKHQTEKNIFEIIKIIQEEKPINYILDKEPATLAELCNKNTGTCDQEVGVLKLNGVDIKLYIYANFDNPNNEPTTYFKLNNKKIGSFVYLDKFAILDKKYLLTTEPNSYNDNYIIHIYDKTGKELASYEATKTSKDLIIKDNEINFEYCNPADSIIENDKALPKVSSFKVVSTNITKKEEVSFQYKTCT